MQEPNADIYDISLIIQVLTNQANVKYYHAWDGFR